MLKRGVQAGEDEGEEEEGGAEGVLGRERKEIEGLAKDQEEDNAVK